MQTPQLKHIPIEKLVKGRFQPRRQFDETTLNELAQSIRSNGLIQPIVVRPMTDGRYEIVAGERRWRAAQLAQLFDVPCLIHHYSDYQAAEVATIENINRENLNPIEEAHAYQRLVDEFAYKHEEVADAVGKSRAHITNMLRLLQLTSSVQTLLIANKLSVGHAKMLCSLPTSLQEDLANKCVARAWSVRKLEQEIKELQKGLAFDENSDDVDMRAVATALSEHLGSAVAIHYQEGKGQLLINFHNLDILQGVFAKMGFEYE